MDKKNQPTQRPGAAPSQPQQKPGQQQQKKPGRK